MSSNALGGVLGAGLSFGLNSMFPGLGALGSGFLGGLGASLATGGNLKKHLTMGLTSALGSHFGSKHLGKYVGNLTGFSSGIPSKLLAHNIAGALGGGLGAMYANNQFDKLRKLNPKNTGSTRSTYTPSITVPKVEELSKKANFKAMYYAKRLKLLEDMETKSKDNSSKSPPPSTPRYISHREPNPWSKEDKNLTRHLSKLHFKNQR